MKEMIQVIINTLESVEVHGSDNMSKLLGCINALTQIINQEGNQEDGEEVNNG